ncbi:hypothetical protein ALC62_09364 [Cyphomyrmex costatus]|uniref:Uncharacterized protein n=1 Tax=Cyphomyrmex costatus TaxID=456900 RepID=A0A195CH40_9HYME|nr:hypothetical protein ALC62_09364 [Cyphomyrmex costatus]
MRPHLYVPAGYSVTGIAVELRTAPQTNGRVGSQMYAISGGAQAALSAVIESMLEECLLDVKNITTVADKSCVTPEEMEKALRKLCLRLNAQPSTPSKQKVNTQREDSN